MAHEDYIFEDPYESAERGWSEGSGSLPNPLFYFSAINKNNIFIVKETEKAFLLNIKKQNKHFEVWMPKKLVREKKAGKYIYIHRDIGINIIIQEAMIKEGLIYDSKFRCSPT